MNKLALNEIVGYLPYGLKAEILDYQSDYVNRQYDTIVGFHQWDKYGTLWSAITEGGAKPSVDRVKPILNRIEDMSEELLDKWIYIQERVENNLQFSIQANEFMYSNHVDIHNLIDRGLAVDKKNYTTMNKELIEQIRNGKALHYDIDNVELLNEVLHECFPNQGEALGRYKYYYSFINGWSCTNSNMRETIHLSSFLPKMISVEAVKEWVDTQSKVYKAIPIDELLTFLNEIK